MIVSPWLQLDLLLYICKYQQRVHRCLPQEGELELEAQQAKHSDVEPQSSTAEVAAHSETLRDTAPVLEGIKVTYSQ